MEMMCAGSGGDGDYFKQGLIGLVWS